MDFLSKFYWYYICVAGAFFFGILWWQMRPTKEGKRFINQDIRWCKDVLGISEQSLYWVARMSRPLTQAEMDSIVKLGHEYRRMAIVANHVIKQNKENNDGKDQNTES
jgi:hypothetical protein